jgi:hypothetical protein
MGRWERCPVGKSLEPSLGQGVPEGVDRNAQLLSCAAETQALGPQLQGRTQINHGWRPTEPFTLRPGVRQSCAHPLLNQ